MQPGGRGLQGTMSYLGNPVIQRDSLPRSDEAIVWLGCTSCVCYGSGMTDWVEEVASVQESTAVLRLPANSSQHQHAASSSIVANAKCGIKVPFQVNLGAHLLAALHASVKRCCKQINTVRSMLPWRSASLGKACQSICTFQPLACRY